MIKKMIFVILLLSAVPLIIFCQSSNKVKTVLDFNKLVKPRYDAQSDTSFNSGSKIVLNELSETQLSSLALLGKVWGFLKYYHPTVAKGLVNWDFELFRVLPEILKAKSKEERNNFLQDWIERFGSIDEKKEISIKDKSRIKLMPDLYWIEDENELGKNVVALLKDIKGAKRDSSHFYFSFYYGVGNPNFDNEEEYKNITSTDDGYRLLSLFRYWNIINYFFPYKNLIAQDWNGVLSEFIPQFIKSKSEIEYRLTLLKLIDLIKDTHANIRGYDKHLSEFFGTKWVPYQIRFIENKAVVTNVYKQMDSTLQMQIGDVVEEINGETVYEIVKRKTPFYPASNYPTKLLNISKNLMLSNNETLTITYLRGEVKKQEIVKTILLEKLNQFKQEPLPSWKILDGNIGYIYPGTLKKGEIQEIMKSLISCKGIIIDLRCYPSDFIVFSLGDYLMPKPTPFVKFTSTNYQMPGLFEYGITLHNGDIKKEYFKGKLVIIVNETTQSQAEYTTMAFRVAPKAKVIGSTTAGADGNVSKFALPGGITTMISGIGVYYPDGTETQGVGIVPDIEIKPTINGIRERIDEPLAKAIELINAEK